MNLEDYERPYKPARRSDSRSVVSEHNLIVEAVLGRRLPFTVQVHHVDGNGLNNSHDNLVVCQDAAYHHLLHVRTRALYACGNPNWRKCRFCKQHDDPTFMRKNLSGKEFWHGACFNKWQNDYRSKKRGS